MLNYPITLLARGSNTWIIDKTVPSGRETRRADEKKAIVALTHKHKKRQ